MTWLAASPRANQGHFGELVLPESVREELVGTSVTWRLDGIRALAGIGPRVLRARNAAETSYFAYSAPFPSGDFRVLQTMALVARP